MYSTTGREYLGARNEAFSKADHFAKTDYTPTKFSMEMITSPHDGNKGLADPNITVGKVEEQSLYCSARLFAHVQGSEGEIALAGWGGKDGEM